MGLFDDMDWGGVASTFLQAAPSVIAAVAGQNRITNANNRAAQLSEQGNANALNELRATREQATAIGAPGVSYLRNVVARDPNRLTPQQSIALKDTQREFNRGPALKAYGGRAFSRMFADTTGRARAGAIEQNRQQADSAANQLTGITKTGMSMSPAIANVTARQGEAAGNAMTANAATEADTMGQISSVFANSMKDQAREQRYGNYKSSYQ